MPTKLFLGLMIGIMTVTHIAQAASFDCHKAQTPTEKMICADKALSELDSQMAMAYQKALAYAGHPAKIKQEQITWLTHTRAACQSVDCLKKTYQQRISALLQTPHVVWKNYTDPKLRFHMLYPSERSIRQQEDGFVLYVLGAPAKADPLLHFVIGQGNFEQGIKATHIFEKDPQGQWRASIGRFHNPVAEKINGPGWTGISTKITCGISDPKTGFHAAGGTCLWALISNGKRYLLADTYGITGLDAQTLKTLMSVKFLP